MLGAKTPPPGAADSQRRRFHLPALVLLISLTSLGAGLAVSLAAPGSVVVVALGFSALAGLLAIIGVKGLDATTTILLAAASCAAPLTALRVSPSLTVADIFIALAALPVLIAGMRRRVRRAQLAAYAPVLALTALLVGGGLIGTLVAKNQLASLSQLLRFTGASFFLLLLMAIWAANRERLELLAWCYLAGATISAAVALVLQAVGGRALGLANHPNTLALASCLAFGTGLGLAFHSSNRAWRAAALSCVILLSLAVVNSGSRAALVGVMVATILFVISTRNWRLMIWGASAFALALVAVQRGMFPVGEHNAFVRIMGDDSAAASDRVREPLRDSAVTQIGENPLTGTGFESALEAHSIYLQLWVSAGALGLIFIFGITVTAVRILLKARRHSDWLSVGMASSYAGYLAASIASNALWDRYIWLHLAIVLGLVVTWEEKDEAAEEELDGTVNGRPPPGRSAGRLLKT